MPKHNESARPAPVGPWPMAHEPMGTRRPRCVLIRMTAAFIEDDPLPSWRDGRIKNLILEFVAAVCTRGSSEFRMPGERIAVFDNDGTLWCEQPIPVQAYFARDQVAAIAASAPSLKDRQPFKAFL